MNELFSQTVSHVSLQRSFCRNLSSSESENYHDFTDGRTDGRTLVHCAFAAIFDGPSANQQPIRTHVQITPIITVVP